MGLPFEPTHLLLVGRGRPMRVQRTDRGYFTEYEHAAGLMDDPDATPAWQRLPDGTWTINGVPTDGVGVYVAE